MACAYCSPWQTPVTIHSPDDLRAAIDRAAAGLLLGALTDVTEQMQPGNGPSDFAAVAAGGAWNDIVGWVFACTQCGQRFHLGAETYHGSGGAWTPVRAQQHVVFAITGDGVAWVLDDAAAVLDTFDADAIAGGAVVAYAADGRWLRPRVLATPREWFGVERAAGELVLEHDAARGPGVAALADALDAANELAPNLQFATLEQLRAFQRGRTPG